MPRSSDKTRVVATAVLLGAALAGCSDIYYDRRETVTFAAANAVAAAQATQTVDPWPPASANRNVPGHGVRVAGAAQGSRRGQVRHRFSQRKPCASQRASPRGHRIPAV